MSLGADSSRTWLIGNSGIAVSLNVDPREGLRIQSLVNPLTQTDWVRTPTSDTRILAGGLSSGLGGVGGSFAFSSASTTSDDTSVTLTLNFSSARLGLRLTRVYVCRSAAPIVETWTAVDLAAGGSARSLQDLNAWRLAVSGNQVQWITGLDPTLMQSSADPFTAQLHTVAAGEVFSLGAAGRATESAMPYFMIQSGGDQLFGGLEWSGAWSLSLTGVSGGVDIALGLGSMSTTVQAGSHLEMPHGFFGVTTGASSQPGVAIRAFADALRGGRAFPSLVTVNTWFEHGVAIDEDSTGAEIDASASLGAELFVLDAGYYPGAGANGSGDYTSGLGTWTWDTGRFPDGLAALAARAHDRGLRFGLWVEPERVALATVGQPGLAQSSYLATRDGRYDPNVTNDQSSAAQICLGSAAARAWVLQQLTALIDAVQPDYLKWDNNFWVNCNAPGHDHGASDGNFAHVQGLYQILAALRQRYPDLVIENCSGGGHRLDFGMLRYADVGWMDDRTSPATIVRHNLEGLSSVLPPSYLFSFVLDTDANPIDGSLDLPLMFRSRMPGVLGVGFSPAEADSELTAAARTEIAAYKGVRDIQSVARGVALSAPVSSTNAPDWDALEIVTADGEAAVYAFQVSAVTERTTVQPVGLVSDWTYEVVSAGAGSLGTATGSDLMAQGIEIDSSPRTAAHLLTLRVVDTTTAAAGAR